ncbi:MAG: PqqD family protein [Acutalibacteraceae bacterium]|nr:PqqD family protein [Acutalibacteraceae bacterium]
MQNDYLLREIAGEYMLVPLGNSSLNSMVSFNETGAFVWKKLEQGLNEEEIANALTAEYNVAYNQALEDVKQLVDYLKDNKVI